MNRKGGKLWCNRCKSDKYKENFYVSKVYTRGYGYKCKACEIELAIGRNKANPERYLLTCAKIRARKENREFNIGIEDIIIPEYCPVLGIILEPCKGVRGPSSPSLDRIDNTKGYIKGNIRVISWRANRLKSDATVEELNRVIKYMEMEKELQNAKAI